MTCHRQSGSGLRLYTDLAENRISVRIQDLRDKLSTCQRHPVSRCKEVLLKEAGDELYYFTSLLNIFQISLSEVMDNEIDHMETLGKYMLK